ncbi:MULTISPECIES: thiolase family protein [unclassified Simplicispira]|uniref:thiolase family protein n=1 Tax=unclassified Simplicispira TaxID=2630407 RepID=UPI000D5D45D0|nr:MULTISPECIES: thiolase family protein [unclassified Simplicispira]PVY56503.1 acetyl-CoA acetyltransferase [Simplicispira sp. 125]REG17448.1 acetyl-CoA acetyltransferase [Simplicispira sp. 110]
MQPVFIAGTGMTRFGKHIDRGLKSLAAEAIGAAIADAGIAASQLQAAYMGNAAAGVMTGQVLIPGQVVLRGLGIGRIPVVNIENACATSATAFQQAVQMIALGAYDIVLVAGFEKLYSEDKARTFSVFHGAVDLEAIDDVMAMLQANLSRNGSVADLAGAGRSRSLFMDVYAAMARDFMAESGATQRDFAAVAAKNSFHGSLNPKAQFQDVLTVEQVLAAPMIVDPMTRPMCAPIGDGAAALVLVSGKAAQQLGLRDKVRVLSSVLASGWDYAEGTDKKERLVPVVAAQAYETAGVGPEALDVVELHDAGAPAELMYYEHLGLAAEGEAVALLQSGATRLGGRVPVNPSGGLLRKGHPIGASGCAQLVELTDQLRGRCGQRQIEGARTALAENGGGWIGEDAAAIVISILQKE